MAQRALTISNRNYPLAGDDAVVHTDRLELAPETFIGKTGRILAIQEGTGDFLLKFKGHSWPVSFPAASCAWRATSPRNH